MPNSGARAPILWGPYLLPLHDVAEVCAKFRFRLLDTMRHLAKFSSFIGVQPPGQPAEPLNMVRGESSDALATQGLSVHLVTPSQEMGNIPRTSLWAWLPCIHRGGGGSWGCIVHPTGPQREHATHGWRHNPCGKCGHRIGCGAVLRPIRRARVSFRTTAQFCSSRAQVVWEICPPTCGFSRLLTWCDWAWHSLWSCKADCRATLAACVADPSQIRVVYIIPQSTFALSNVELPCVACSSTSSVSL